MNTTTTKPDLLSDTDERAFQALDTAIALAYTADLDDPELAAEHRNAIDAAGHLRARLSDYQANGYEAAPKMTAKEAMRVVRGLMSSSGLGDDESNEALSVLADLVEECERLKQKWVDSMGDHVAVSVEAEELQACAEKAEATLAKWRPVIEAVEKARKSTLTDDRVFWGVDEDAILQAALAYKKRSGG